MKDENSLKVEIHDNYKLDGEIQNTENKYYFIFHQRKLLLVNNQVPLISDIGEIYINEVDIKNKIFIGLFYDNDCFAVELNEDFNEEDFILKNKDNDIFESADLNQIEKLKIEDFYDEAEHNLTIKNIESGKIKNLKIDEMNQSGDEYSKIKNLKPKSNENEIIFHNLFIVFEINEEVYLISGRAIQIIDWENNHQFCGRCGAKTVTMPGRRVKICPECGFKSFTRISPSIITTITKAEENENGDIENKLLMAKHSYHKGMGYTLVAGFLEAGETIEDAVKREVREEVGVEVEDIRYFASQSWPFPNSLMIGCTCKYKSGEIKVDGSEIVDAKWFSKEEIDNPPLDISIFSRLVEDFKENY